MDTEISSKVTSVNDTFIALTAKPLSIEGIVVLPSGTVVEGRVIAVSRAALGNRTGRLEVAFETLKTPAGSRRIEGVITSSDLLSPRVKGWAWLAIVGGSAAGMAIGGSISMPGAVVGGAVGAGIAAGIVLINPGKDIRIKSGQEFEIEMRKEVVLPVPDY